MRDYIFTNIHSYDCYNRRANKQGIVSEWRVEAPNGQLVGIADTKKEALAMARRHHKRVKAV